MTETHFRHLKAACSFFRLIDIISHDQRQEKTMIVQGVIKGKKYCPKKIPVGEQLSEGDNVEVIILPVQKKSYRFSTFKLGVKKECLKRDEIYARSSVFFDTNVLVYATDELSPFHDFSFEQYSQPANMVSIADEPFGFQFSPGMVEFLAA